MQGLRYNAPKRDLVLGACFYLLVFLVYFPVLGGAFVWDDAGAILDNPYVTSPTGIWSIWLTDQLMDYWPLTYSLFWLEWQLWGGTAVLFHIVNLLLHASAALVLWRVLCRLAIPGAWLIAAAFAVHPVSAASAAWIVEGKNTLSLLLGGVSLLFWLRFDAESKSRWYWLSLAAFTLTLLAKTSLVALPLVMLLCVWWRHSRITSGDIARIVPFIALSIILGIVTIAFQNEHAIHHEILPPRGFLSRLAGTGWSAWFYGLKILFPANLSVIYPTSHVHAGNPLAWLAFLGLAGAGILALVYRDSWGRAVFFAGAAFVLILSPALGFIDMSFHRFSLVADQFQYAAMIAPLSLVIGSAAAWLPRRLPARWFASIAGSVLVGVLGVLTWMQAAVYKDNQSLWEHVAHRNPEAWAAHYHLGIYSAGAGAHDTAIRLLEKAVELKPDHAKSYNSLGAIYAGRGEIQRAESLYRKAITLRPNNSEAHNNLGLLLAGKGNLEDAVASFEAAVSAKPDYAEAFDNLAVALAKQGDHRAAAAYYRRAILLKPDIPKSYIGLGAALAQAGEFADSVAAYRRAVELAPDNASARFNLGLTLCNQGEAAAAVPHLSKVVSLYPGNAEGRFHFARALADAGDCTRAMDELVVAVRLRPDFEDATRLLNQLQRQSVAP